MTAKVDYIEVGRKAHELVAAHGVDGARKYAAKLADEALAEGSQEEHDFWRAIEVSLKVR